MDIVIFQDVSTESAIRAFEENGKKYDGLYVDMNNAPERKYVKDQAKEISDLLKKLDRSRIDKTARYKSEVEKEANEIRERLKVANEPFTLLIDEHKAERAKALAEEKSKKDAIELANQIECDHEIALLINKTYEFDKEQERLTKEAHDKEVGRKAVKAEKARQEKREEEAKQRAINEENARLANVEHVRDINISILGVMISLGLDSKKSKEFIKMIAKKQVSNLTINY